MTTESDQKAEFQSESGSKNTWDHFLPPLKDLPHLFADMAACVRFFSRLSLTPLNEHDNPSKVPDFQRIARAAPLAGAFIALPAAGIGLFLGFTQLPPLVVAIVVVSILAIITGALHEDGLSDLADGFFGGSTKEKRLEIMKDSRIGAFGALALVLGILLRVALLAELWQRLGPADAALLFLSSEVLSRALLVWQWQQRPLARPDGLAARFGKPGQQTVTQALIIMAVLLIPTALVLSLSALFLGLLLAAIAAFATGKLAIRKIDGVTGDVLGAIQQVSSLGFLLGLLMVP
ncbi:MAG: adenosylcobinamide-GDP ribazoletransferase [Roseibium sp.]